MVIFGPFTWKTKGGNRVTIFGAFFTIPLMGYSLWQLYHPATERQVSPKVSKTDDDWNGGEDPYSRTS